MEHRPGGWYELLDEAARPGSRYKFRIDDGLAVPDPASRAQPDGVHGDSMVVDPQDFDWSDADWTGRRWEDAVIYELHVGTFSPDGGFAGVEKKLDHLERLGVTAVELMPVAQFPGTRGWGYDGTLLYAPQHSYGRPADLKALVQAAHRRGLMMVLDVVYNHFGPDGNYLGVHAPQFFTDRHKTPWGKANNFDGPHSATVRDFFIHNALYWLEEFNFDGLRFDAVHAVLDDSEIHFLTEMAERIRARLRGRHVHLILENDDNAARFLDQAQGAGHYTAQWNDDIHHCLHVILTGESGGYYADYADRPMALLGRCLTSGFAYQGERSSYRGEARGEPSGHLTPLSFVSFLQNHDQIGNRALGERLGQLASGDAVRAALALLLLAPSPPMLFMGEEWAAPQPFLYFCEYDRELGAAVREGRRREFAGFPEFQDERARDRIPDPNDPATCDASRLNWADPATPEHRRQLEYCSTLLALRRDEIAPRLAGTRGGAARFDIPADGVLRAAWVLGDGSRLGVTANFGGGPVPFAPQGGRVLFRTPTEAEGELAPYSVVWEIEPGGLADERRE
jgi:malto-oligosyltrehalose trehalohydrolase